MNCPCRQCNGLDETSVFFGNSITQANEPEEEKEFQSLYERLSKLHSKLIDAGVGADLVNELGDITEEVDRIDDKLADLQKKAGGLTGDEIQYKIGEISQDLY